MTSTWLSRIGFSVVCAISGSACGNVSRAGSDAGSTDAPPPSDPKVCDPLATFGAPTLVAIPGLDGMLKRSPSLSPDELTMYFDVAVLGGESNLYVTTRASRTDPWSSATPLTSVNSSSNDDRASVSSDGLTLWLTSNRTTNQAEHIFVATRTSTLAAFGTPAVASINASDTSVPDACPFETADNQELWFASARVPTQGSFDIWRAPAVGKGFGTPVQVLEIESTASDGKPLVSADRLTLYLSSSRPGGSMGSFDIWRTHRQNVADGFPSPVLVPELSSAGSDAPGWISADNCRIYTTSFDGTTGNIYLATRTP